MSRPIQLIIVGAQKAGTTSLFRYLAQHPEMHTHVQNEMCYFTHDEFNRGYDQVFLKYFGSRFNKEKVLLAKQVMIMYSQEAVNRLYNHNPQVQIIAILRNPIRRAYSAYWYARRMGWEKIMTFEDAIKAEPYRLREGWLKWSNCAYLSNGEYYTHIFRLMERFSEKQIHTYILEDMKNNPDKVCQGIFSLFKIDHKFSPMTGILHNEASQARSEIFARAYAKFLNPNNPFKKIIRHLFPYQLLYKVRQNIKELNKKEFSPPPMNPETKKFLIDYFIPHNEKLSRLINRNIDHWNKADE